MCARLVQVLNSSYIPLYLTDTLGFEKVSHKFCVEQFTHFTTLCTCLIKSIHLLQESIAYFPLVILISGVFSSLCAKKLDKMLGDKVRGTIRKAVSTSRTEHCWLIPICLLPLFRNESKRNHSYENELRLQVTQLVSKANNHSVMSNGRQKYSKIELIFFFLLAENFVTLSLHNLHNFRHQISRAAGCL